MSLVKSLLNLGELAKRATRAVVNILKHSTFTLERGEHHVFLEINEPIRIKTLREILILFDISGYNVFLRARLNRRTLIVGNLFEWHRNLKLVWRDPVLLGATIVCTDKQKLNWQDEGSKVINLRYDYNPYLRLAPGHFAMPIPMHPQIYVQYRAHERLEEYRYPTRKVRLFFAGNWYKKGEYLPIYQGLFGKLTRHQILEFLQNRELVCIIKSHQELESLLSGAYWNGFALLDKSARVNQREWLSTISRADFFLCPPGGVLPWCHNCVEAMAVGTIPLINYPDWFFPNLTHRVNCMTFSTFDELERALDEIRQMSEVEIARMRKQVIDYYSQYLDPQRFVDSLVKYPDNQICLHIWAEDEHIIRQVMCGESGTS
jgi:hypothetical protein